MPPIDQEPDAELVRQAARGSEAAFASLVERYADRIYATAYSLLGNAPDAEDAVQETFAGAWRGLSSFRGESSVRTWLTGIVIRQAARLRRNWRRDVLSLNANATAVADSHQNNPAAGIDARMDLAAVLLELSEEHRQTIVLRELEGLSYDEMAEVLRIPRGTVESRLHRARGELRKRMQAYNVKQT